ncbi:MAG TPA: protease inhibitor I9 family protein, partial [Arenimonas sp.]|nr:protease inhibitor I9 family protein [Arenimonas sp.]
MSGARENAVQANGLGGNSFNRPHYEYSEAFNEGNGYVSNKGGKIGLADNGGTFIVIFKEDALASYKGGKSSLPMPSKRLSLTGKMRLDVKSAEARNYVGYLQSQQSSLEQKMSGVIGRTFGIRRRMQHAVNGEIIDVTREEAALLEKMPEVMLVEPYREVELDTDTGPQLIGAS